MTFTSFSNRYKSNFLTYHHSQTRATNPEIYSSHAHNGYELLYILEGIVSFGFEEQTLNLKTGDIIITPPSQYHFLQVASNEDYERINLLVSPEQLNLTIDLDKAVLFSDYNKTFKNIIKDFSTYFNKCAESQRDEIFEIKTRELIFAINHLLPTNDVILNSTINETLKNVLNFINANLKKNVTVADIAKHCFLSEGHIFHLFYDKLKTSPMNYIKTKKMLLAQNLISNAKDKKAITSIAHELGFEDYSVFYRNYVKFFNHKPSDDLHKL